MGVADDIYPWERKNIDRADVGPDLFNVRRAATDVEKGTVGTSRDQPPVVIGIKEAESRFLVPNTVTLELTWIEDSAWTFGVLLHRRQRAFGL